MAIEDVLLPCMAAQVSAEAAAWLDTARGRAAQGPRAQLLRVYTEASKHLGRSPFVVTASVAGHPALANVPADHWTLEDVGRLVLLLARSAAFPRSADDNAAAAIECYEQGDTREQYSWLRTVALLPEPARFLTVVIDACRTSIVPLFEAVACENTYPAGYFPEPNFNQMVLKALFDGIALDRIIGLASRKNPELSRMASDYAAELRAAGRRIPADIPLALSNGMAAQRTER